MYGIGASIRDAIPHVLRRFYDEAFFTAFSTGRPWQHIYECSTPHQVRSYRMRALRVGAASPHIVICNDAVRTADAPGGRLVSGDFIDPDGLVTQCAHCRRCRKVGTEDWEWVPSFVARPMLRVSHSLCSPCLAYHYPA